MVGPSRNQEGDDEDRLGFIRKVYGILSVQLMITTLAIAATQFDAELKSWMQE